MKNTFQHLGAKFLVAAFLSLAALTAISNGAVLTLAGFEAYPATSTGGQYQGFYLFNDDTSQSTFANISVTEGTDSESSAIALPLSLGVNEFTFSNTLYPLSDSDDAGIALFFTSNGMSFNPSTASSVSNPDLSAFTDYPGSSVLSTPAEGTSVPDYASSGGSATEDAYSGAKIYAINGYDVSITALTASGMGGSFDLTVTRAIPEPGTMAMLVMGGGLLILMVRRSLVSRRP